MEVCSLHLYREEAAALQSYYKIVYYIVQNNHGRWFSLQLKGGTVKHQQQSTPHTRGPCWLYEFATAWLRLEKPAKHTAGSFTQSPHPLLIIGSGWLFPILLASLVVAIYKLVHMAKKLRGVAASPAARTDRVDTVLMFHRFDIATFKLAGLSRIKSLYCTNSSSGVLQHQDKVSSAKCTSIEFSEYQQRTYR